MNKLEVYQKAREVVQKVRKIVLEGKWTKGDYVRGGNYCLMGAIGAAAGKGARIGGDAFFAENPPFELALAETLTERWPRHTEIYRKVPETLKRGMLHHSVVSVNDNSHTKKEDILGILDSMDEKLEHCMKEYQGEERGGEGGTESTQSLTA